MRILLVHTSYVEKGGEDVVFQNEMALLHNYGHEVNTLLFDNKGRLPGQLFKFLISVFNLSSYRAIIREIDRSKPDIVHVHNWFYAASPSIFFALKRKRVPVVVTLHNYRLICPSGTLFYNNKPFQASIRARFPWYAVMNSVYRKSFFQTFWLASIVWFHKVLGTWKNIDKYITLTQSAKQIFLSSRLELGECQISVKPNFIHDVELEKGSVSDTFLYVGRLNEEKGIQTLLAAFERNYSRLKIIGDGPLKKDVEECCKRCSNIEYLGFRNRDFILNEMMTSNALIFPSVWFEGMPITILEAFACGTPVIASNYGAMQSMIVDGENGFLFEVGNPISLKNTLLKWKSLNCHQLEGFRKCARRTYEEIYTPEKNIEQLLSIYKSLQSEGNALLGANK